MTIADGLMRLTHVVSTSPMSRPACRTAWIAVEVAAPHELDDILTAGGLEPRATRSTVGERPPRRDRLEAAAVAAVARHVFAARDVHVPDVAGRALGAALQEAAGDDPGADAGRHLDEDQVVGIRPGEFAFAERHHVDVVVDEHRHVEDARAASRARRSGPSRA